MIVSYLLTNFITLMILVALVSMMIVNRDVRIPATRLFVVCIFLLIALTIVGVLDTHTDVSGLSPVRDTCGSHHYAGE